MKKIPIDDAVGKVLSHDMTRIIPGQFKGVGFKKGHVIREEDIAELKSIGKNSIYILDLPQGRLHEDSAALRIARAVCGPDIKWTAPSEGKSKIISQINGLLKIEVDTLLQINRLGDIALSTIRSMTPVTAGQTIAATRVIPLTIAEDHINAVEKIAQKKPHVLRVLPYQKLKTGAIVTGTEVYQGLIDDEFDQYVGAKFDLYNGELLKKILVPDDTSAIADAIEELINLGCEFIVSTGGLSVDPDDVTLSGVKLSGAQVINYGSPVFPGAMVLYAKHGNIPILGLPACVYHAQNTIFDILLPRILANEEIKKDTFAEMGHGGMCLECEKCQFPNCTFGIGM